MAMVKRIFNENRKKDPKYEYKQAMMDAKLIRDGKPPAEGAAHMMPSKKTRKSKKRVGSRKGSKKSSKKTRKSRRH